MRIFVNDFLSTINLLIKKFSPEYSKHETFTKDKVSDSSESPWKETRTFAGAINFRLAKILKQQFEPN